MVHGAFTAIRALFYMSGFVLVWGWLALWARSVQLGPALPPGARGTGTVLMILGAAVVMWCVAWFVVVAGGTPAPFDALRTFVAGGPYRLAMPAALVAHLFVLLYEEPALRRRFGPTYVAYLALVNRWVPRRPRKA